MSGPKYLEEEKSVILSITKFGTGTLTWQDPVHSWKTGPGEVMTAGNKQTNVTAEVLELLLEQL